MAKIDPKYLKGLKYRDSVRKEIVRDGRKFYEYTSRERDLTPEDVGAVAERGENIVFATYDGQKYTFKKMITAILGKKITEIKSQ